MAADSSSPRTRYVAICPDCEKAINMAYPPDGDRWPQCDDCWQSMNVYERTTRERQAASQGGY